MSDIDKKFPNATPRPWAADTREKDDCVLWGPGEPGKEPFLANVDSGGGFKPATLVFDVDAPNCELIAHAVNTYDARDEALREAMGALRNRQQIHDVGCFQTPEQIHTATPGKCVLLCQDVPFQSALAKIESVLVVKEI